MPSQPCHSVWIAKAEMWRVAAARGMVWALGVHLQQLAWRGRQWQPALVLVRTMHHVIIQDAAPAEAVR